MSVKDVQGVDGHEEVDDWMKEKDQAKMNKAKMNKMREMKFCKEMQIDGQM